jgi:hypothetical protein
MEPCTVCTAITPPGFFPALISIISDSKFWGIILGSICASLIIPGIYRRQSRNSLLVLIRSDLKSRMDQLEESISLFAEDIENAEKGLKGDKEHQNFMPCFIHTPGNDYLDWQKDKWLLSDSYAAEILEFYNEDCELNSMLDFMRTAEFKHFTKRRKLDGCKSIVKEMIKINDLGKSLSEILPK